MANEGASTGTRDTMKVEVGSDRGGTNVILSRGGNFTVGRYFGGLR